MSLLKRSWVKSDIDLHGERFYCWPVYNWLAFLSRLLCLKTNDPEEKMTSSTVWSCSHQELLIKWFSWHLTIMTDTHSRSVGCMKMFFLSSHNIMICQRFLQENIIQCDAATSPDMHHVYPLHNKWRSSVVSVIPVNSWLSPLRRSIFYGWASRTPRRRLRLRQLEKQQADRSLWDEQDSSFSFLQVECRVADEVDQFCNYSALLAWSL